MLWLIGMMGSGKSSVGRRVAAVRGIDFIDTDQLISSLTESSITDIWEQGGEAAFRHLERDMITNLAAGEPVVVATGGGAVLDPGNVETMRAAGLVVWLEASPETLASRLGPGGDRPLLARADNRVATLERILSERQTHYVQAAHHRLDTDGKPIDQVVDEVLDLWTGS